MRFLSREGRSNLVQYGLRRHFYTDVYHSWLRAPWRVALGAVTVLYLVVNCLFAVAYRRRAVPDVPVANQRGNQVVEAQIRVTMLISEKTREGSAIRRNIDLHLRRSQSTVFALSWTVVHPLTPDSPFVTHTREQLLAGGAEIIASLTGLDDAFNQTIHSRHSWSMEEIAWNARFADIIGTLPDGRQGVDYRRFHDVLPLERQTADGRP